MTNLDHDWPPQPKGPEEVLPWSIGDKAGESAENGQDSRSTGTEGT